MLISIDNFTANCRPGTSPGLVLFYGPEFIGFDYLLDEETFLSVWSQEGQIFFARTANDVFGVKIDSDVIDILRLDAPAPILPSTSRWVEQLAWNLSCGVWCGGWGMPSLQVFASPASLPVWSRDWQSLFFVAQEGLFIARAPEFTPTLLKEGVLGTGAFWVKP
jgi:hypothetical protein